MNDGTSVLPQQPSQKSPQLLHSFIICRVQCLIMIILLFYIPSSIVLLWLCSDWPRRDYSCTLVHTCTHLYTKRTREPENEGCWNRHDLIVSQKHCGYAMHERTLGCTLFVCVHKTLCGVRSVYSVSTVYSCAFKGFLYLMSTFYIKMNLSWMYNLTQTEVSSLCVISRIIIIVAPSIRIYKKKLLLIIVMLILF